MNRTIALLLIGLALSSNPLRAQSPLPVVVPAATAEKQTAPVAQPATASGTTQTLLEQLQQIKAANEETIHKQTALLEQLDQIEKAADQLRIYSKRS